MGGPAIAFPRSRPRSPLDPVLAAGPLDPRSSPSPSPPLPPMLRSWPRPPLDPAEPRSSPNPPILPAPSADAGSPRRGLASPTPPRRNCRPGNPSLCGVETVLRTAVLGQAGLGNSPRSQQLSYLHLRTLSAPQQGGKPMKLSGSPCRPAVQLSGLKYLLLILQIREVVNCYYDMTCWRKVDQFICS